MVIRLIKWAGNCHLYRERGRERVTGIRAENNEIDKAAERMIDVYNGDDEDEDDGDTVDGKWEKAKREDK